MNKNDIVAIIVTFNIGDKFSKCYNSIKGQVGRVIIVDNGSEKETTDYLNKIENEDDTTIIIYNKENLGIATALNIGVKKAIEIDAAWVITLDNDSKATPKMIENMVNQYNNLSNDEKEKIVSLFPVYIEEAFNEEIKNQKMGYDFVLTEITSGNLIKTSIYEEIGFYREDFFIDYVDIEFSLRLAKYGYKQIKVQNSFLLHNLGNSTKKRFLRKDLVMTNHSPLRRYYLTRNSLYVWKEYISNFKVFVIKDIAYFFYKVALILLFEDLKKQKIKMIYKGTLDFIKNKNGVYKE